MDNTQQPKETALDLAVAAILEGNPNPMDDDMTGIGESDSDLDLPEEQPCRRSGTAPIRVAAVADKHEDEMG